MRSFDISKRAERANEGKEAANKCVVSHASWMVWKISTGILSA